MRHQNTDPAIPLPGLYFLHGGEMMAGANRTRIDAAHLAGWRPRVRRGRAARADVPRSPRVPRQLAAAPARGVKRYCRDVRAAFRNSRLRFAMLVSGIPFGHDATHSPVLVQPPKPSASMVSTMSSTRRARSG